MIGGIGPLDGTLGGALVGSGVCAVIRGNGPLDATGVLVGVVGGAAGACSSPSEEHAMTISNMQVMVTLINLGEIKNLCPRLRIFVAALLSSRPVGIDD